MKILKTLFFIVIGLAALIAVLGLIAPKDFHVEKSVTVNAPLPMVNRYVTSLELQNSWSVWAQMDPNQKITYEGEDGKPGSRYSWEGEITGKGSQELVSVSPERAEFKLVFIEPYESQSDVYFDMKEAEEGVEVTWGFNSEMPFPMNIMLLFGDGGIGDDFQEGLNNLKATVETAVAEKKYRGYTINEVLVPATRMLGIRQEVSMAGLNDFFMSNMEKAGRALGKYNASQPSGLYYSWDEEKGVTDVAVAMAVDESAPAASFEEFILEGRAVQIDYYGNYEGSGEAHYAMDDYFKDYGLEYKSPVWEHYVTDPTQEPDTSKWLTKITYFIK